MGQRPNKLLTHEYIHLSNKIGKDAAPMASGNIN